MAGIPENEVINLISDDEDFLAVTLNYGHNAFQPPAANPQAPSQPPVRDGFSRDTGEDVVALCPSCGRELAYDPDESPDDDNKTKPATAKTSRNKRDKAEHYFFAVKACGHVSPPPPPPFVVH